MGHIRRFPYGELLLRNSKCQPEPIDPRSVITGGFGKLDRTTLSTLTKVLA